MMRVVYVDEKGLYVKAEGRKCRPTTVSAAKAGGKYPSTIANGFASTTVWLDTGFSGVFKHEPWVNE